MADELDHSQLIAELCSITGADHDEAKNLLENANWDVNQAAMEFYTSQDERQAPNEAAPQEEYTGPRTLDGRLAPQAIPSSSSAEASSSRPRPAGGIATLGSLKDTTHAGHGHAHDDDDDDDDDSGDEKPRDLFAGGEKSGLAVQDPTRSAKRDPTKSIIKDILKKAKANTGQPSESEPSAPSSHFRGSGMTLGGDDTPSRVIPDPTASQPASRPTLRRTLHLWEDGFSVDDGDLRRFDDPQHQRDLEMIRSGRAPLHLMNAEPGQVLDVQLNKHNEKYQKPKTVWKPFSGSGQRLGSPTPGSPSISTSPTPAPAQSALETLASVATTREVNIDPEQPTVSLRLQLLNGTRLVSRFNTTHTIGDVYDFINRASTASSSVPWILATTFPNKDHTDMAAVLGDLPEFRKGGTAVQKKKNP